MSFINTRTTMGEQAAFDALIEQTITEINEDEIRALEQYSVSFQKNLISVNFPNVTRMESRSFQSNPLLETIDIGSVCLIRSGVLFNACPGVKALILRGTDSISILGSTNAFTLTKIGLRLGGIYVPRALLSDYCADATWSAYSDVIRAIEDMPITDFSTITHTWTQIKSMIDDESFFASSYTEGDYKQFTYGDYTVLAEIVKINMADKYVDFLLKNPAETLNHMSTSGMTSYSNTAVKQRLDQIYADELPSDLKAAITPVSKKYHVYDGTTETVTAPLWLLNSKDVNATGNYLTDSEGEEYSVFLDNGGRQKRSITTCDLVTWTTGSAYSATSFVIINTNGTFASGGYTSSAPIIFGFRIQKSA